MKFGTHTLAHRVVLAPLTRFRADENNVPLPKIVKEYYEQRASVSGTLLITEATFISPRADGYANVPGIWNEEQIKAWKEITDAVHAKGSFIYVQLWALGRLAKPDVLEPRGLKVVSSSAVAVGPDSPAPHALEESEIQEFIQEYAQAARNAIKAGFDGVEIHGANGYLPDQFLSDVINKREDKWGGSIENRSRFHLEVTKAVIAAIGKERTGVRVSPFTVFQPGNVRSKNLVPQFTHVIKELRALDIAFLHLIEPRDVNTGPTDAVYEEPGNLDWAVKAWGTDSPVIIAGGFTAEKARQFVEERYPKYQLAIGFGRYFISTPDLAFRLQKGIKFTPYNRTTFYNPGSPVGYTDYPFSPEFVASVKS
jgi:NADPH2 dehydrogenase